MGDRGFNAGGFAYMDVATCPECGVRRKLGRGAIEAGRTGCGNRPKCEERKQSGRFLHRLHGQHKGEK